MVVWFFFQASSRNSDLTGTELAFSLIWGYSNQRQRPLRQREPDRAFRRSHRQPSRTKREAFQDRTDTLKRQLPEPKLCSITAPRCWKQFQNKKPLQRRCTHRSALCGSAAARGCTPEAILSQDCASFHATRRARGSGALKGAVRQLQGARPRERAESTEAERRGEPRALRARPGAGTLPHLEHGGAGRAATGRWRHRGVTSRRRPRLAPLQAPPGKRRGPSAPSGMAPQGWCGTNVAPKALTHLPSAPRHSSVCYPAALMKKVRRLRDHRITESVRLEKTTEGVELNLLLTTTLSARP